MSRLIVRVFRDETATTSFEYVVTAVGVALVALGATRALASVLVNYLRRVYLVVTLPIL